MTSIKKYSVIMIKKIVFLFCFYPLLNIAQNVNYLGSINNWGNVRAMDMEKTSNGELIIAVDFPGSRHMGDYYGLYKINNSGNIDWRFKYSKDLGLEADYVFLNLTLDETDNIYAMLSIDGLNEYTINGQKFYPGLNFTKISPFGEIVWNQKIGESAKGEYGVVENACVKYKNGNLYVIGTYTGILNLEDKFHFESQKYYQCYMWMYFSGSDYFIAKYDTTGHLNNAISLGEDYPDNLINMEIDDSENIYFTGISDNFPCVHSYQHITKLDNCLKLQWVNILSHDNDSPYYIPMNVHYSNNGKIYLWNNSIDNVSHGIWVTDNKSPCLMEIDPANGNILRTLNINADSRETGNAVYLRRYVNGFMDDFGNDLIVHTAFLSNLIIENDTIHSEGNYHTLCLLKIDLENFSVSLIKVFEGKRDRYFLNMPEKLIVDKPYIYFTGEFGENPLNVFGTLLSHGDGNIFDKNVFYCKVDMRSYLTDLEENVNPYTKSKISVFPNPVANILYIHSELDIKKLTIFSVDGKFIFSAANKNSVDVSKLSNGIYIISVVTNDGTEIAKVLIKH